MKKELEHFYIGESYGGNQDWFRTFMMRIGGCGAETACDSSLYFALRKGVEGIYPYDLENLTKEDYVNFAHVMEGYLWPRMMGINKPEVYINGYAKYLSDRGISSISMDVLPGTVPYKRAAETIRSQIDAGLPVPTLILNHRNKEFRDYFWHWFLINGYDDGQDESGDGQTGSEPAHGMLVRTVTYSMANWLDLRALWDTGHSTKGGLVLFSLQNAEGSV